MPDFTPRPTTYKGIQMRSRLEAGFAAWLDARGVEGWEYEPRAFASEAGQYLPDFRVPRLRVSRFKSHPAYIEVKPAHVFKQQDERHAIAIRMAVIWESEPDAHLIVASPTPVENFPGVAVIIRTETGSPVATPMWGWWAEAQQGRLEIALPLYPQAGPWFGEYWNVQ